MTNENSATVILQYIDPYGKIVTCVFDSISPITLSEVKKLILRSKTKL